MRIGTKRAALGLWASVVVGGTVGAALFLATGEALFIAISMLAGAVGSCVVAEMGRAD